MATIICPNNRPQMSTVRPGVMQKMQRQAGREGVITDFAPKFDTSKFKVKLVKTEVAAAPVDSLGEEE